MGATLPIAKLLATSLSLCCRLLAEFSGNRTGSRAREQPPAGGDRFVMLESERDLVLRKSSGGA